jgi:hypothetical protein
MAKISADRVTAPDTVSFRSSPLYAFLFTYLLFVPVGTALWLLTDVLLDPADAGAGWGWVAATAARVALTGLVVAAVPAWQAWRSPTSIRSSSAGLEIATRGGDPVFLAWPEIVSAVVRRRGVIATALEVAPTDVDQARSAAPESDLPRMRETPNGPAYVAELGYVRPSPAALRVELARRSTRIRR